MRRLGVLAMCSAGAGAASRRAVPHGLHAALAHLRHGGVRDEPVAPAPGLRWPYGTPRGRPERRRGFAVRAGRCVNLARMGIERNERPLEEGIHTDLDGRITYGGYLRLDQLLSAQQPLSELWLKLAIHELTAAIGFLRRDQVWRCQKVIARCKQVLRQLTEQWSVLETLTPSEYMEFRDVLGPSSGFQSLQYRTLEFL